MKQYNLNTLVKPPFTDSISGRDLGIAYSQQIGLLEAMDKGEKIEFIIDDTFVKAINDSFVKGLFSAVFEKYKTVTIIQQEITIVASDHFKRLFAKNWRILENIYHV